MAKSTQTELDPIARFIEDMEYLGKSERTRDAYERVLRDFREFVSTTTQGSSVALSEVSQRDCMEWVHELRENDALRPSTVATYAAYLNRFYGYMNKTGAFDANPMGLVMEEMDESITTDPNRRDISVPAMREFVATITHPLERAVVVTFLKTGIRVGELANLDLRDVHLDDPEIKTEYDVLARPQIETRPDSLYVASNVQRGHEVNGEVRTASNKRQRVTIIPVDAELKHELKRWLTIRPVSRSPADPLFVGLAGQSGVRLTTNSLRSVVQRYAERRGWYRSGGGPEENVTPHYFRHFFTTHLRDRTGDRGVVKYLRGDVADDVIDTYTHQWGDLVRDTYETHIYQLHQ